MLLKFELFVAFILVHCLLSHVVSIVQFILNILQSTSGKETIILSLLVVLSSFLMDSLKSVLLDVIVPILNVEI